MPRAYIRLDPEFADRKEGYPDGAFVALVMLICAASEHVRRGTFKNAKLARVVLARRARWLPYLVEHGDLVEQSDGSLYIDGWEEWQEGNWKVAERMARVREKRNNARNTRRNQRTEPVVKGDDYDNDNDRAKRARPPGTRSNDRETTKKTTPEHVSDVLKRMADKP